MFIDALLSAQGQELLARLAADDATPDLALGTRLRREYPADLVAAALTQYELRLSARAKFSQAMRMLFTRAGLEQSSAERIGRHRARRYEGRKLVADLCCGIGGDLITLPAVLAVDRDEVHARLARHNASIYQTTLQAAVADVRELRLGALDAVFIDPARRTVAGRMRTGTSEPPLEWCFEIPVPAGIKAAPGIDLAVLPPGWEAEFIADGRDLKEATLWSPRFATAARRATVLTPAGDEATLLPSPGDAVPVAAPGEYLLDPNPAVTRAGLVEELARSVGGWKIDDQIAFIAAGQPVRTPFARTLRVLEDAPWNEKDFARRLRALGIGAADIRRRGLAGDVDQIRRRLRLEGPRQGVIVLTRAADKPWGLICEPVPN
jgi:THUMP domain-like/RNA cap guanine-N2 methyltransferase